MKWVKLIVGILLLGICINTGIALYTDDTDSSGIIYPVYNHVSMCLYLITTFAVTMLVSACLIGGAIKEILGKQPPPQYEVRGDGDEN